MNNITIIIKMYFTDLLFSFPESNQEEYDCIKLLKEGRMGDKKVVLTDSKLIDEFVRYYFDESFNLIFALKPLMLKYNRTCKGKITGFTNVIISKYTRVMILCEYGREIIATLDNSSVISFTEKRDDEILFEYSMFNCEPLYVKADGYDILYSHKAMDDIVVKKLKEYPLIWKKVKDSLL